MANYVKGSRKIIIDDYEFRWSVTGNDGFISIIIWSTVSDSKLIGTFEYHSEYCRVESTGEYELSKGQIVITSRVIRAIIEHVTVEKMVRGCGTINLGELEKIYDINQAIRRDDIKKRKL